MRILIINTWYFPNMMGGAEHSVKLLAENLVKKGFHVAVFCVDGKEDSMVEESINGVDVFRSNGGKYDLYGAYYSKRSLKKKVYDKYHEIFNKSVQADLKKTMEMFSPNLVHCNCIPGISLCLFETVYKNNIPLLVTLRNYFMLYPSEKRFTNRVLNQAATWLYRKLSRRESNKAEAVVAPSEFTLNKHLDEHFFSKAYIRECIPNCVMIDMEETKRCILDKFETKGKTVNFLYVGWISERKGIRMLLDSFSNLQDDNISLTFCGNGSLSGLVEDAAKKDKRIVFLGKLSSDKLREEYMKADVLVVPSIWEEPFGRVIIEGNMYGLSVICSNRGGMPEIIRKMKSGITFDPDDKDALRNALKEMLNKEERNKFCTNIVNNIEYYSVENQIEMYKDVYYRMIK